MQQLRLLESYNVERSLDLQQVKASFKKMTNSLHEVVLEVNSQKFLITIKAGLQQLEKFEVIAVK